MRRVAPPVALCAFSVDGDYILQDFGGEDASHLSKEDFEKLCSLWCEEETSLGVGLKSWCAEVCTWATAS